MNLFHHTRKGGFLTDEDMTTGRKKVLEMKLEDEKEEPKAYKPIFKLGSLTAEALGLTHEELRQMPLSEINRIILEKRKELPEGEYDILLYHQRQKVLEKQSRLQRLLNRLRYLLYQIRLP